MDPHHDLKTQHFSAVFTALDAGDDNSLATSTRNVVTRVAGNRYAVALLTGIAAAFLLLTLRPPFTLAFEVDQRRPWQARSQISWAAVGAISLLVFSTTVLLPSWLQQPTPSL